VKTEQSQTVRIKPKQVSGLTVISNTVKYKNNDGILDGEENVFYLD